jgi:Domain of unknown function (DUF5047)
MSDALLLEDGDALLLESGDGVLLESSTATITPTIPYPVDFDEVIRGSHRAVSVAEILNSDGTIAQTLTAISGSVTISATNARRRSMSLTIVDAAGDLTPTGLDSLLAPVSVEIRLRRGVEYADGTQELHPLGVFRVDTNDIAFEGGTISMSGFDRSVIISRNRWLEPYVIEEGTPTTAAIADIARNRYPGVVIDMAPSDHAVTVETTLGENTNNDPWRVLTGDLGVAAGLDVYFDAQGILTARPFIGATGAPERTFHDGVGGTIVGGSRQLSGENLRNGCVVFGEGADGAQIRAERWDTNPASPTYAGNPVGSSAFGARPFVYENQLLNTYEQCLEVADLLLPKVLRLADSIGFQAIVDPTVDVSTWCAVQVERPQVNAVYAIHSVSIPLDPGGLMDVQAGKDREMSTVG